MSFKKKQSMTLVAVVFDNLHGIEVMDGRELGPSDVLGCTHYPL